MAYQLLLLIINWMAGSDINIEREYIGTAPNYNVLRHVF